MRRKVRRPADGSIPGVKWPAPEPASAPGSQIIERPGTVADRVPPSQPRPQIACKPAHPEPCVNCGKCPRCGQ